MTCPHYIDYTRMCAEQFHQVLHIANLDYCDSEEYIQCPFYRLLHNIQPICPYVKHCPIHFYKDSRDYQGLLEMANTYCLSSNYPNCARYHLLEEKKEVPVGLHPKGILVSTSE